MLRITQLVSRLIAIILTSIGVSNVEEPATAIASGIVAIGAIIFDLYLHKKQQP